MKTRLAYSRTWHAIDIGSDPRSLGRVASSIAMFLMGKHKPIYDPSTDCGDYVVALGCRNLHTTGKKRSQKLYYTHNTRPGSLKSMSMEQMIEKWGGAEVLRKAVKGMLPKNRLREKRMARLKGRHHSLPVFFCLSSVLLIHQQTLLTCLLKQPSKDLSIRIKRILSNSTDKTPLS